MIIVKTKYISILLLAAFIFNSCCTFSSNPYKGPVSDHFNGKNFYNTFAVKSDDTVHNSISNFLKWRLLGFSPQWCVKPDEKPGPKPPGRVPKDSLRVTFIGHATVLLQFDSINVITDPVFSNMIGPISGIGQTRKRIPGIKFEDLPPIDVVLISHNHYDHMDIPTLLKFNAMHKPVFFTSLGNKNFLNEKGINNVVELDWNDSIRFKDRTFYMTPANHFSMRGLCDRNTSLWAGFVIETSGGPVFFSGDTGYGYHFKKIKDLYQQFRLAIIPISPIEPRAFMKDIHASPLDAVKAHIDLNSKMSMPIHFSTFKQGNDIQAEPVRELTHSIKLLKVNSSEWMMPAHGKGVYVPSLRQ